MDQRRRLVVVDQAFELVAEPKEELGVGSAHAALARQTGLVADAADSVEFDPALDPAVWLGCRAAVAVDGEPEAESMSGAIAVQCREAATEIFFEAGDPLAGGQVFEDQVGLARAVVSVGDRARDHQRGVSGGEGGEAGGFRGKLVR